MRTWSCKARSQGDNEISIQKNREPRYPIGMNSLNASSISIRSPRIPIIPLSFAIRFYFWRLFRIYHLISRNISTIVRASNPSEIEQQARYQYWKTMLISDTTSVLLFPPARNASRVKERIVMNEPSRDYSFKKDELIKMRGIRKKMILVIRK